jgi:hypothetical protein
VNSLATFFGVAATVLSFNLPATEGVGGIALGEFHSGNPVMGVPSRDATSRYALEEKDSADAGPANAWLYALGFLGLVVLRRTRSGPMI